MSGVSSVHTRVRARALDQSVDRKVGGCSLEVTDFLCCERWQLHIMDPHACLLRYTLVSSAFLLLCGEDVLCTRMYSVRAIPAAGLERPARAAASVARRAGVSYSAFSSYTVYTILEYRHSTWVHVYDLRTCIYAIHNSELWNARSDALASRTCIPHMFEFFILRTIL
eukprot:COSAG02_NODE_8663_length_2487_cov_1.476131_2_plen_168_part_00